MKNNVQRAGHDLTKASFTFRGKIGFLVCCLLGVNGAYANPERVLMQAPKKLSSDEQLAFHVGESFVHKPWVIAPSTTTARDGLGPRYNAAACADCHRYNGKMRWNQEKDQLENLVLRLGNSAAGFQLQPRAVPGLSAEGSFELSWQKKNVQLADGAVIELRKPLVHLAFTKASYATENFSLRAAPILSGVAVFDEIDDETIRQTAKAQALRNDAIKGRVSELGSNNSRLGRFGWKAEVASLERQVALALHQDMGITSAIYPEQNCNSDDALCIKQIAGGAPEISDHLFMRMLAYVRALELPERRIHTADEKAGEQLFNALNCSVCHVPDVKVGNKVVHPYSDLLLHDMGQELADTLDLPNATARQWRTAPLQGIGIVDRLSAKAYLHDGRARNLLEAILWHGGEAQASRDAVVELSASERQQLILFLKTL